MAWVRGTLRMTSEADDKWCRDRIHELEDENRELRHAATRFGELAERLNMQLRNERRQNPERRQAARNSGDRRQLNVDES